MAVREYLRLPGWIAPSSATPSRTTLARSAAAQARQSTAAVAALGARAPLIFGRCRVRGLIGTVGVANRVRPAGFATTYSGLTVQAIWGLGEIDAVEAVVVGGRALTHAGAVYRQDYLGTASQAADPLLAAAITDYTDTCRGTQAGQAVSFAYTVFTLSDGTLSPPEAIVRGLACYDPRTTTRVYTTNPALQIGRVLELAGQRVDWASVEDAADYCDESVGGAPRWTCSLAFRRAEAPGEIVETLRAYAHCLIGRGAAGWRLVPDAPRAVSLAVSASQIAADGLRLGKRKRREVPTAVRVSYTTPETDVTQAWGAERTALAATAAAQAGTETWRDSPVPMPGIQSYGEAYRAAIERLNRWQLCDLSGEVRLFDEGLQVEVGDVITLTHPLGLSTKSVRVLDALSDEPGRWGLTVEEYDAAVYSNAIVSDPSTPDTGLPDPFDVPAVTGLAAVEEVYQRQDGTFASRLRLTWASDDYPYAHRYSVRVSAAGALVWSATPVEALYVTGALQEGVSYTVAVAVIAEAGVTGAPAQLTVTAQGKQLVPGNVPSLSGFEVGGEVRLHWEPALDIDIWRYEVRYGTTSAAWADMTRLDRVDGLRLVTSDVPAGTWRFAVKAIDSVGQESAAAATRDITVTLDTRAFFVGESDLDYSAANSANIYSDVYPDGTVVRWSEAGTDFATLFPSNIETYTDIAASYDGGSASEWESAVWDLGAVYVGTWQIDARGFSALGSGDAITVYLELSTDNSTWGSYTDPAVKVSARYARVRVTAAAGNVLLQDGTLPAVRLDVVTREESGTVTTSASAAATVTLSQTYEFANWIGLQPSGTAVRTAVYDNVQVGDPTTFDVYLFDGSGAQISGDVSWRFQGV